MRFCSRNLLLRITSNILNLLLCCKVTSLFPPSATVCIREQQERRICCLDLGVFLLVFSRTGLLFLEMSICRMAANCLTFLRGHFKSSLPHNRPTVSIELLLTLSNKYEAIFFVFIFAAGHFMKLMK